MSISCDNTTTMTYDAVGLTSRCGETKLLAMLAFLGGACAVRRNATAGGSVAKVNLGLMTSSYVVW